MRTSLHTVVGMMLLVTCFTGCGRKQPKAPAPAPAPSAPASPATTGLSATPALDPKGTIDRARQDLDAAKAKEQAGTDGL